MDPEEKKMNFIFPTKYRIPKSLSRLAIGQVRNMGLGIQHGNTGGRPFPPFQLSANRNLQPIARPVCCLPQTFLSTLWRWFGFGQGPSLGGWGKRRGSGRIKHLQNPHNIHGTICIFTYMKTIKINEM